MRLTGWASSQGTRSWPHYPRVGGMKLRTATTVTWSSRAFGLKGPKPPLATRSLRNRLHLAAKKVGISGPVGFLALQRTLAGVLVANGSDPKLVQELFRHANIKTTLDIYAKATTPAKIEAQTGCCNNCLCKLPVSPWVDLTPWVRHVYRSLSGRPLEAPLIPVYTAICYCTPGSPLDSIQFRILPCACRLGRLHVISCWTKEQCLSPIYVHAYRSLRPPGLNFRLIPVRCRF